MFARVVEQPTALPAQCKGCGAGTLSEGREWWVDTGTFEEFYGQVYYCSICMTEIAELCGFLGPDRRIVLDTQLKEANAQIRELKESLSALTTLGIDVGTLAEFVSSHYVSLEGTEGKLDELIARAADAAKSPDESGPSDVPNPQSGRKPKLSLT